MKNVAGFQIIQRGSELSEQVEAQMHSKQRREKRSGETSDRLFTYEGLWEERDKKLCKSVEMRVFDQSVVMVRRHADRIGVR